MRVGHDRCVLLSNIEPYVTASLSRDSSRPASSARTHLLWFCDGLLAFYLVSWTCTRMLRLDNDVYYVVFIWAALTFLYHYTQITNIDVLGAIVTRWRSSLFVGLLVAIYIVASVWRANPTEHPAGARFVFEILWRGFVYGSVSSLVLTAFPMAVAHGVFGGNVTGPVRRLGFAALTLVLIWVMSTSYHLGFEQFDDEHVAPQLITTSISLPAMVTANPVGSVAAQTAFHVAATVQTFESDLFVPPAVEYAPQYEPPGVFGPR